MRSHVLVALAATILAACGASPAPESSATTRATSDETREAEERPAELSAAPASEEPSEQGPSEAAPTDRLRWELVATPARIRMSQRARFRLSRRVTNDGSAPADAMHARASFTVDGAPSMVLDMAFGNGVRGSEWSSLAPGATASDDRDVGESLFEAPGDYDLAMTVDGVTVHAQVHVDR